MNEASDVDINPAPAPDRGWAAFDPDRDANTCRDTDAQRSAVPEITCD